MDILQLLKLDASIKVEVSISDLKAFADYLLEKNKNDKLNQNTNKDDIGGIELAMEITGYAEQTIRNKVNKNQIPYKKVQGKIWFSRTELLNMINSGNNDNRLKEYMK
jgi:hypothetical protein